MQTTLLRHLERRTTSGSLLLSALSVCSVLDHQDQPHHIMTRIAENAFRVVPGRGQVVQTFFRKPNFEIHQYWFLSGFAVAAVEIVAAFIFLYIVWKGPESDRSE